MATANANQPFKLKNHNKVKDFQASLSFPFSCPPPPPAIFNDITIRACHIREGVVVGGRRKVGPETELHTLTMVKFPCHSLIRLTSAETRAQVLPGEGGRPGAVTQIHRPTGQPQANLTLGQLVATDSSKSTEVLHRQLPKHTATAGGAAVAASVPGPVL